MRDSSRIRSVLIGVEYQNCHQSLDVYLQFAIWIRQIQSKLLMGWMIFNLQFCKLV